MKKLLTIACMLLLVNSLIAQNQEAPYKKDPNLPAFSILQSDSTWFTAENLPPASKYPYVCIVYFQPSCGHCQIATKDLMSHMDELKNVFFVFVSFSQPREINEFAQVYGLNTLPNVKIGRDPKYFIPSFFRVESTPFTALYDQKRKLIKVFDPPHGDAVEAGKLIPLVKGK